MGFEMIALRQSRREVVDGLRDDADGIKELIKEFNDILTTPGGSDARVYILLGKIAVKAERIQNKVETWGEIIRSEYIEEKQKA